MNSNPVLALIRIALVGVLVALMWLVFWQGNRREAAEIRLAGEVSQLRAEVAQLAARQREAQGALQAGQQGVDRLSGSVETLTHLVAQGAVRAAPGDLAAPSAGTGVPAAPRVSSGPIPAHVQGRARALWGRYPDFLKPDPDPIVRPPLDTPGMDPNGRVRTWFQSALSGLNPITKNDGNLTRNIKNRCMAWLCAYHDKNPDEHAPWLATRVEVNPEFTEYVIWLRKGVKWQTPQLNLERYPHLKGEHEVTARDVKFAVDLILNPAVEAPHLRSYYSECEGVEVVDDHCLIVRWKKKQWNSIAWTLAELAPMPEFLLAFDEQGARYDDDKLAAAINDHWFYRDNRFLHCGPYVMVEYDPASHCLLRRNESYFEASRLPPIREIFMEIFPDRELQVKKLMAGEHDYGSLLANDWDRLRKDPNTPLGQGRLEENWVWSTQFGFIAWKMTHPIFRDLKVRTAMTLACDRFRMNESLHLGKSAVVTGPAFFRSPFAPEDLKPLPFDLERAKALLAEAGWKDADGNGVLEKEIDGALTELRFTAMVPQNKEWANVFEIFKEDLAKIGAIMTLEPLQWGQFSDRLDERKFDCTALYWDTSGWDSDFHQIWHSSQIAEAKSSNFIEFQDPDVDRWIEEARVTFDREKRKEIQRAVHRRIAELQPYTFMHTTRNPILTYPERITNVKAGLGFALRPFARLFPMYVPSAAR
jgi:peptide/nickel transport system substrate-binding protein